MGWSEPGRAPRFSADETGLQPGSILGGRYEILKLLGEGGMGAVYQARDCELDRDVALKVIRPELAKQRELLQRFKQELILARQVTHRNVIRIFDLGEAQGIKFITMEYVAGEDLRALLRRIGKLDPDDATRIMVQVCDALQAAHAEGVVHRDLKPQNIMIEPGGRAIVMDFGIARSMEMTALTRTGALVGTPDYMSPEQAKGEEADRRSDLFTVGIILYELLTGKTPYRAETVLGTLLKRTQERARPPIEVEATVPRYLSDVVMKCLEIDPERRYQEASQLAADLQARRRARTGGVTLRMPRSRTLQELPARWIAPALALVLLVSAGLTFRGKIFGPRVAPKPAGPSFSLAILPFRNAGGDPSLDWLGPSLAEMLRTDVGESSSLATISTDRVQQLLRDLRISSGSELDPATVHRVAQFTSADLVLSGQYLKIGDEIRIDATLRDLAHQRTTSLRAEAATDKQLLGAVDQLAHSVQQNLALSGAVVKELQAKSFKPSTQSVPALRSYSEGLQLVRQGKNLDALKQFQASTKEDPKFALAYAKLSQTYAALGYDDKAREFSRHAVDLSESLPAAEKYFILANQAQALGDHQKATEAYEQLAKILPDDPDVQFALARLYEDARLPDRARALYNKLLARDPKNIDVLVGTGRVELYNGNPQGSLEYFNRALALAVELENDEQKGAALFHIGDAYWMMNKLHDAVRNYEESLAIRRRLGDKRGTALTLNGMGVARQMLGQWDQAFKCYQEALTLQREIGDKRNLGLTLLNVGNLYDARGQYDQALAVTKESLQIHRDLGDPINEAMCLNNIGSFYQEKGDYDNAITYFQQALQLSQRLTIPGQTAGTLESLGQTYSKMGQYDQGVSYYLQALDLSRKADDIRGIGIESYDLGTLSEYQGRYGAGLSYEEEAFKDLQQVKEGGNHLAEVEASYGNALTLVGRGKEAQKKLDEALSLARQLKNDSLMAGILNFQGDRLFYQGEFKAARARFEEALKVAQRSKDHETILNAQARLATLAVKEGRSRQAVGQLKELARDGERSGLKYLSLQCSTDLGEALLNTKDYPQARQELDHALAESERLGLRALLARDHYLMAVLLRQTGAAADAATHFAQASGLLDEIRKESGSDAVLKRSDIADMYGECTRASKAPVT